jgi:hypothetical protein
LNRWIVPMERRVDYLSFLTGGKMTVPFEIFLVFSTNLGPSELGDEAFLRRIKYKMLLRGPSEREFVRIFEEFCTRKRLPYPGDLLPRFVEKRYKQTKKVFRRCHPRDLLTHALDLIHFEKLPFALTEEILDRAYNGCFLEEDPDEQAADSPILPMTSLTCSEYWSEKLAPVPTSFGRLAMLAGLRADGRYQDPESEAQFGEAETTQVLYRIQRQEFGEWRALARERRIRDMERYLQASALTAAALMAGLEEWVEVLAPPGSDAVDRSLFTRDLTMVLETICPPEVREPGPPEDNSIPASDAESALV